MAGRGADDCVHVHPIGMAAQIRFAAIVSAVALQKRHEINLFQSEFLPIVRVGELASGVVADDRPDGVVKESPVLHQFNRAQIVFKATVLAFHGEVHGPAFVRLHRRVELVHPEVQLLIVSHEGSAGNINVRQVIGIGGEMNFRDRL